MPTRIPNQRPIDLTGSANVAALAAGVNGQTTLVDYYVPSGATLVVTAFANYAAAAEAFGSPGLFWTLFVDGMPHPDFQNIRDQIGTPTLMRNIAPGLIKATNRLQVVCYNDSGSAQTGGASIQGYTE